ncbi:Transcriptional activator of proteases prtT [Psilocybe cubensis]|uniref:Xylanolytic transcriptional activator regulatory domain-containing protein n=2 Tax=Psilocybe cubensis TaxID=181762 RepID=A0A8H7XYR0_PSICU|nr:Transcriptional activator of proteases prtT [Psilocybe cubensis]KAH9481451.1 Transcriptional activator of proteases prtT [Psilocybe cubensis]
MSNSYNMGQQWNQSQLNFSSLQLEQDYEFAANESRQQQQQQQMLHQQQQQAYASSNAYHNQYSQQQQQQQQQQVQNPNAHSSSLMGAFSNPLSQQHSHSRSSSFGAAQSGQNSMSGAYAGLYGAQATGPPSNGANGPYRQPTSSAFTFSPPSGIPMSLQNNLSDVSQGGSPSYLTSSPGPLHESFSPPSSSSQLQQTYFNANDTSGAPQPKRHHGSAFKDESAIEDPDSEVGQSDTKDKQSKLKREHLLNQIQAQAKEIERLMHQLEKVTISSNQPRNAGMDTSTGVNLSSPVLTPSSNSGSFFGSDVPGDEAGGDEHGGANGNGSNNVVMNKAVEEWIAKARESLHEFGAFIGIGGAGMPKRYLVEEDYEGGDDSDDDEEYVDASDEALAEAFGNGDERYEVTVDNAPGDASGSSNPEQGGRILNHKSSSSSIGTVATANTQQRKKNSGENAKPVNLPVGAAPFGLFGELSLKNPVSRAGSAEPEDEDRGSGIANANFFKSTLAPQALGRRLEVAQHQAPSILTRGIITPLEAEKLFKIYFDNMNLSVSLLDPVLYTAQRTFYRSPFLFTVICAVASRFYFERPDLYAKCMHYAQWAAGTALIGGNKNVEMCSAYILLSLYPVPAKKWEDQRSWLYLGLAIRVATDINLHVPTSAKPLNENHAREMLNRTRVWLNCFNLDRSTGSQYGKPPIISSSDYIANNSPKWWNSSPHNMPNFDIHISAYNAELRVMSSFIAKVYSDPLHPTNLNKNIDFEKIAIETDDELQVLRDQWFSVLETTDMNDPHNRFRTGLLRLAYSYARLIALSYGFQHAFGKTDRVNENPFLERCLRAAFDVVDALVSDICRPGQLHFVKHGPEAQSVFVTFASAFLVKLLQPRFTTYLTPETRAKIRSQVQKVADLLGSPEVAIDERHGPKLYSRFLEKLLAKPMASLDPMSPGSTASSTVPLPRQKSRTYRSPPPATTSTNMATHSGYASNYDAPSNVFTHPSPSTSNSLSPPPTESALSFDNFAPAGPIDPYVPQTGPMNALNVNPTDSVVTGGNVMMNEFFQPPLPFDDHIMQSMQSLTDPSGWQDISLPVGFNWMAQFQENLGLDLQGMAYDQSMDYMTGPSN